MPHLERSHLGFEVEIFTIKKEDEEGGESNKVNYCYVCTKTPEANENMNNIDLVINNLEREEMENDYELMKNLNNLKERNKKIESMNKYQKIKIEQLALC